MPKRSHEPIFWSLFGAGGVVSAMVLPVLVLITGTLWPLGLMPEDALGYARMESFAGSLIGALALLVVISLTFWHAAHRIAHSAHDLGMHRGLGVWKAVCYGAALLGTLWTAAVLTTLLF